MYYLIISYSLREACAAVEVEIYVRQLVEQLLGFPAVFLWRTHLEVVALWSAQLLQAVVEHRRKPVG